ncbi:MAG TPA: bifunctional metallophosphatase/5'-nucleotidase [Candidatus Faecousia intestinavium]|nr:bifunctional metallophosphatase/5'-nucleotidase [Candidatus Faecousia intestinavium]
MKRRSLALLLCLMLVCALAAPAAAAQTGTSEDIVILYTNDVHTYIDGPLSYDVISGIKKELETQYAHVLLVDAGDHVQGTAYGSMDKGETIIQLMNAAGYDLATLGNHEFDYGMDGCMQIVQWAQYPYVSCNFYEEVNGVREENVLPSYQIFDCGTEKLAIVGITTPESFTKSTPSYFQDESGNYIYGISGGEDGSALYADVQAAIDSAVAEGATKVIALGHLGDDLSSQPWTSAEVIANVSGLSAFIDGHSHSTVEGQNVTDKDGNSVVLTQTGQYFGQIGMMVISAETGEITTGFIGSEEILEPVVDESGNPVKNEEGNDQTEVVGYRLVSDLYTGAEWCSDETVAAIKDQWIAKIGEQLGTVIGSTSLTLDNYSADGTRLVRSQETNTGDFAADALYYLFDNMDMDVDVAIMNGGGIRNEAVTGEISYQTCKTIHTFGNVACLQTITGQQLLDALEWGARTAGTGEECGGFLQVSGITYKIDTQWPDSTQKDEKGVWIGGPTGGYRVHDVKVYNKETNAWDALDLEAHYNLAGYNYTLRDLGDGFNMFDGAINVLDYVMEDYMVLANYVQAFEGGVVEASNSPLAEKYEGLLLDYSTVDGSGRIVMEAASRDTEETAPATQTPDTTGATVQETVVQTPVEAEPSSSTPILIIALASCAALAALAYLFQKKEH